VALMTILDLQAAGHRNVLLEVRQRPGRRDTAEAEAVGTPGPSAVAGRVLAVEPSIL
jgi:hypothetical protein